MSILNNLTFLMKFDKSFGIMRINYNIKSKSNRSVKSALLHFYKQ